MTGSVSGFIVTLRRMRAPTRGSPSCADPALRSSMTCPRAAMSSASTWYVATNSDSSRGAFMPAVRIAPERRSMSVSESPIGK